MKISIKEHLKILGCFIGLFIAHRFIISQFVWKLIQRHTTIDYVAAVFIAVSFAVVLFMLYVKWAGWDTFRWKGISWKIWLWTFLLCISQLLFVFTVFGYPVWLNENNITYGAVTQINLNDHIINSFNGIFCYSIITAMLYRGLLQKQISKFLSPWLSISIVTLVMMLANYNFLPNLLPAFLSGIFVGIIYHKTDKLILCIFYQSFFTFIYSITRYSLKLDWILLFFVLAIALTVFTIRGFLRDTAKNNLLLNDQEIHR